MDEHTQKNERILARERKAKQLWDVQEQMLKIDEESWVKKWQVIQSTQMGLRRESTFRRSKSKVLKERREYLEKKEKFFRHKEKRVEESISGLGENCLPGSPLVSDGQETQQLLPGIPDAITLCHITTKLSWREILILKSVTRGWYAAVQNHSIYNERVRSHSTQTSVFLMYCRPDDGVNPVSLCCWRDDSCFELPRIPYHDYSNSNYFRYVTVGGKFYVLGGLFNYPSDKVYMLDVAGNRPWTQVASMQTARANFGFGVMDGKIYVFGGENHIQQALSVSEVYDPTEDRWSSIAPMNSPTKDSHSTIVVGEELLCYGARVLRDGGHLQNVNFLELYNPVRDEWRSVKNFAPRSVRTILSREGKLYSLNDDATQVYNFAENSWTQICLNSYAGIESGHQVSLSYFPSTIAVENDLLTFGERSVNDELESCVLRSKGFDTEKGELEWREEIGWNPDKICNVQFVNVMYPIEL